MTVKIEVELKCSHCDKRSKIPASGLFPKHHPVNGNGYFGKKINRRVVCAGSGIDAMARVVAEVEQRAKNSAQHVLKIGEDIKRLSAQRDEVSARVDAYMNLLAKINLRGGK